MKQIKFFALMLLAGATLFTGCKDDEPTGPAPTISFSNYPTGAYEIDFATLGVTTFDLSFVVSVTAEEEISTFTAKKKVGSSTTNLTAPADFEGKTSYTYNYLGTFLETDTYPVELIFTCTDKADQVTEMKFTVTKKTGTTPNPINTYPSLSLTSAFSGPTASEYVNAITGVLYNHDDTGANTATFGFVSGGGNGATFIASDHGLTLSSQPANWTTVANLVTTSVTAAQFDAITNETELLAVMPSSITEPYINHFEDGGTNATCEVFAFEVAGKKGLVKVPSAIDNTAAQVISISIKVQQ